MYCYICIRVNEWSMRLSIDNQAEINGVLFNLKFINSITDCLRSMNEGIRKLPYKVIRFFLVVIFVLVVVVLLPMLYLSVIFSIRRFKKTILQIESQLMQLSIKELNELKANLNLNFKSIWINARNLNEINEDAPFVIRPLVSIVTDVCRDISKVDGKIDEQIEHQYTLFNEALDTDTMIGGDEKIEYR